MSKIDSNKIETGIDIANLIKDAVTQEINTNWKGLKEEQQSKLKEILTRIAEEQLAIAMTDDAAKKESHRTTIKHYEAAICHIKGVTKIKAYNSTISVIGRVLAGILLATGKALI